jgi:hypothetical protein
MRAAIPLVFALTGCSLYFGSQDPPEVDPAPDPNEPPIGIDGGVVLPPPGNDPPAPAVYTCQAQGACTQGQTEGCAAQLQCAQVASVGDCSCPSGTWTCEAACSDGLCSAEAVQAAITGTWSGTVSPPSFAQPYHVTLTVGADRKWSAVSSPYPIFYYGDNGGAVGEKLFIQAQTSLGAYGTVRIFGGDVDGMIEDLHVSAHHLTFTFVDSWLSCTRQFYFDLAR